MITNQVTGIQESAFGIPSHLSQMWVTNGALFKALGDKNRQKLLYLLRDGERCVSDLLPFFDILQPTVSTHLLMLEETGFLKVRREGRKRYYSISNPKVYEFLDSFIEELSGVISR
ncbi:MAG: metalloregulator ArsR/SmtB family transcription factor [Candidatus Bathyarchaeota archaeon]|nr:metalloregulator ArsR/SmtB family transcription factor [Candidatus Bathyarchaeota archaeon]